MLYDTKWDQTQTSTLPKFKPRWWHRPDRLDARPVAWSLRNRPEDWEWDGEFTITHTPSNHSFWIANGAGFYRLYEAACSCRQTRGHFQRFQQRFFGRAFKHWRNHHGAKHDPDHFAAHFVR